MAGRKASSSGTHWTVLERVSWIAGIVGAIAAVWAIVVAGQAPSIASAPPSSARAPAVPVIEASAAVPSDVSLPSAASTSASTATALCPNKDAVFAALNQGAELGTTRARDKALFTALHDYICLHDLEGAERVSTALSTDAGRDEALAELLVAAINQRQTAVAARVPKQMQIPADADAAREKVMAALRNGLLPAVR